jgi:hypothetical protein
MFKGYFKGDEKAIAFGFLGATAGTAVVNRFLPKQKLPVKLALGTLLGLATRAAFDPELANERKTT